MNIYKKIDYDKSIELLERLEPYLDNLICYASTIEEYEPNKIVKDIKEYLTVCRNNQ
jgi:hypothetical protein